MSYIVSYALCENWVAYANPTPATTGRSETSFIPLNLVRRTTVATMIVNNGVEALTTWWNYFVSCASSRCGQLTYGYGNELEGDVANGDIDCVED
jgi:hypothetical protein